MKRYLILFTLILSLVFLAPCAHAQRIMASIMGGVGCLPNTITIGTQPSSLSLTVGGATGTVGTAHSTRTPGGLANTNATADNADITVASGVVTPAAAGTTHVDWNEGAGAGFCAAAQVQSSAITVSAGGNSDTFNGTNGTTLAAHNSNWADVGYSGGDAISNITIQSNKLQVAAYRWPAAYYSISSSDTSQAILVANTYNNVIGPTVRSSSGVIGYVACFGNPSGGNWGGAYVYKNNSYLGAAGAGTWAQGSNHTVKIVATGTSTTTLTVWVDGVSVGTVTDSSTPYTSGHPGFTINLSGTGTPLTLFSNWQDF